MNDRTTKLITRQEAIEAIETIVGSGIICEEIEGKLEQIARCLSAELSGRHEWGADPDEVIQLYIAYREDLWTEDKIKACKEIDKKLRFVPSPEEEQELIDHAIECLGFSEEQDDDIKEYLNLPH